MAPLSKLSNQCHLDNFVEKDDADEGRGEVVMGRQRNKAFSEW